MRNQCWALVLIQKERLILQQVQDERTKKLN